MVKILSQSGNSLADTYDVQGSVAGIEQLETRELPIVHEMGATVFSERYSTFIRSANTGAIAQSTAFNVVLNDLPGGAFRVFAIQVFIDTTARIDIASVAARDRGNDREIPIWIWDSTPDGEVRVRFVNDGAGAANVQFLQPSPANIIIPHMMAGAGQPQFVGDLAFRGTSNAFGAGTVTATVLIHLGFSAIGGVPGNTTSRGLPIPSW